MPLAKLVFLSAAALFAAGIQGAAAAELPLGMKAGMDQFAQAHSGVAPGPAKVPVASLPLSMLRAPQQRIDLSSGASWMDPAPTTCSIRLREMRIDHPEQFASRKAALPGTLDDMPRAKAPAPACGPEPFASRR
jgi:hypothetical protein